jgi:hypothetical protein
MPPSGGGLPTPPSSPDYGRSLRLHHSYRRTGGRRRTCGVGASTHRTQRSVRDAMAGSRVQGNLRGLSTCSKASPAATSVFRSARLPGQRQGKVTWPVFAYCPLRTDKTTASGRTDRTKRPRQSRRIRLFGLQSRPRPANDQPSVRHLKTAGVKAGRTTVAEVLQERKQPNTQT